MIYVLSKNKKNIIFFNLKIIIFTDFEKLLQCLCNDIGVTISDDDPCSRSTCECDVLLAECLGQSEFRPEYQDYDRTQCI